MNPSQMGSAIKINHGQSIGKITVFCPNFIQKRNESTKQVHFPTTLLYTDHHHVLNKNYFIEIHEQERLHRHIQNFKNCFETHFHYG